MTTALRYEAPPNNPDVQSQRAGYSIQDRRTARFLTPTGTWGPAADALVIGEEGLARYAAIAHRGQVTTVPRFNGHVYEWTVL
jgi:hypothetical protein